MRFTVRRQQHHDDYVLHFETPVQPTTDVAIQEFFQRCASSLEWAEEVGCAMYRMVVSLGSAEELVPSSPFLAAMCKFIAEYPFPFECGRDYIERLRLIIDMVPTETDERAAGTAAEAADSPSRSNDVDDVYAEAASRIVCAFWQNARLRLARYVAMNVPFVPSQELLNRLVAECRLGGHIVGDQEYDPSKPLLRSGNFHRVTVVAGNTQAEHGHILQVGMMGSLCLCTVGADNAARLMDRVLNVFGGPHHDTIPMQRRKRANFVVASDLVADVVATRLRDHGTRPTTLQTVRIVAATPDNLELILPAVHDFDEPYLDGSSMFHAAMSISSVEAVAVAGFRLTNHEFTLSKAANKTIDRRDPSTVAIVPTVTLSMEECTFPSDPVRGVGAFVASLLLSGTRPIEHLILRGTCVPPPAMDALCRALAAFGPDGSLRALQLGRGVHQYRDCLDDEAVEIVFRALPALKSLKFLLVSHSVPTHLFRTALDGVKDNYWIERVVLQAFKKPGYDDDHWRNIAASWSGELSCYLSANIRGRRAAVYDAAMALQGVSTAAGARHVATSEDDRRRILHVKVGAALRALEDFANMGDSIYVQTGGYLCVRMFVPAALGGCTTAAPLRRNDRSGLMS